MINLVEGFIEKSRYIISTYDAGESEIPWIILSKVFRRADKHPQGQNSKHRQGQNSKHIISLNTCKFCNSLLMSILLGNYSQIYSLCITKSLEKNV